jgi:brefeldin A-resistance guanine nucleotide exchange factor 1
MRRKSKKKLILAGAAHFNKNPKASLAFLEENGLIYHDPYERVTRPQSLARFLKCSTRVDNKLLGDFISRPENTEVLKAFVSLFDFRGVLILFYVCLSFTHQSTFRNLSRTR